MARATVVALSLALFLAVLDFGACLRCYHCTSQADATCNDPFKTEFKKVLDCDLIESQSFNRAATNNFFGAIQVRTAGSHKACHKIVTQSGSVIRTCLDVNPTDPDYTCRMLQDSNSKTYPGDVSRAIKACSHCDTDICNGSGSITASFSVAALAAIITYLIYKQ